MILNASALCRERPSHTERATIEVLFEQIGPVGGRTQ